MTIEERLIEIVEKEQGDAIIPFLQGLTQEERKSLAPCLNKLEEYYTKFVQLIESTYGTRRGIPEKTHRPDTATNDERQPVKQSGTGETNRDNASRTSGKVYQRFKEVVGNICRTAIINEDLSYFLLEL